MQHSTRGAGRMVVWFGALTAAALMMVFAVFVAGAQPAMAEPPQPTTGGPEKDDGGTGREQSVCASESSYMSTELLPAERWSDASAGLHSRMGGGVLEDVAVKITRDGYTSQGFSLGNWAWSTTTSVTMWATRFCPLDLAGGAADRAAAKIGKAIIQSPLPAAGLVVGIAILVWRKYRGTGGNLGELLKMALIIGLIVVMVAGAGASKGGGADGNQGTYKPGSFSPGWFITTVDQIVSSLVALPVKALNVATVKGPEQAASSQGPLSCAAYTGAMKEMFQDKYGASLSRKASASVPVAISSMWEQSGLTAWKTAQFGDTRYGDYLYCRMLESRGGSPFADGELSENSEAMGGIMLRIEGVEDKQLKGEALAWRKAADEVERDRQMIGWALCRPDDDKQPFGGEWTFAAEGLVPSGASKPPPAVQGDGPRGPVNVPSTEEGDEKAAKKNANDICNRFFGASGKDPGAYKGKDFDTPVAKADVAKMTDGDVEAEKFINVLHGQEGGGGQVAAFAYVIAGLCMLVVFGVVAFGVIIAKLAAIVMIVATFLVLAASLFTLGGAGKAFGYFKKYVGLSFYVFASGLLLSMLTFISKIAIDLGGAVLPGGANGLLATMWGGMAPLLAIIILVTLFKKTGLPSPFSIKGALAWSGAAGAVGSSAGPGLNRIGAGIKSRARRMGRATLRGAGGGKAHGGSGGGRTSRVKPDSGGLGSSLGAGVAGGVVGNQLAEKARGRRGTKDLDAQNDGRIALPETPGDPDDQPDVLDRVAGQRHRAGKEDVREFWGGLSGEEQTAASDEARDEIMQRRRQEIKERTHPRNWGANLRALGQHKGKALAIGAGAIAAAPAVMAVPALAGVAAAGVAGAAYARRLRSEHTQTKMIELRKHLEARQQARVEAQRAVDGNVADSGAQPRRAAGGDNQPQTDEFLGREQRNRMVDDRRRGHDRRGRKARDLDKAPATPAKPGEVETWANVTQETASAQTGVYSDGELTGWAAEMAAATPSRRSDRPTAHQ